MRTVALLLLVPLLVPEIAAADRSTHVAIGGMIGGVEHLVDDTVQMQPAGGPRITLSFEHPALAAHDDTAIDFTIVPELVAAAVMDARRGEALGGVGARGEIRMSLRDGLQTAFYAAGRALLVGGKANPAGELALGEYFYLTERLRFGGEGSLLLRRTDELMGNSQHGILVTAYLGFSM